MGSKRIFLQSPVRQRGIRHIIAKLTEGWQISPELMGLCKETPVDKITFGSVELGALLKEADQKDRIRSITLIGLCIDICVISNALN